MLVNPSMLLNALDAGIDQPREEISVDDESAPFLVEICGGFGSYNFIQRFALLL